MDIDADLLESIGRLGLFADFDPAQTAKMFTPAEDVAFAEGERIVRRGQRDLGIHVIVTGDVSLAYEDEELAILPQGSFLGEISALRGELAFADVISPDP